MKAETFEAINKLVVVEGNKLGIETGEKVRADCTVVESNIHHPTESSLLWDCVRVLVRIMGNAEEEFGITFSDHSKRAKRRAMNISNAKSFQQRKPVYRDLIKITNKTMGQAEQVAQQLDAVVPQDIRQMALLTSFAAQLRHYVGLTHQVVSQTERRVVRGESVPPG